MSKDGQNFRDKYKIKDDNKITKIETPTKKKENFDNIKDNIFNNKLTTKHTNKNNLPFPKIQKSFLLIIRILNLLKQVIILILLLII
jgi:hypothetical protein